jgi:hypothetical protein
MGQRVTQGQQVASIAPGVAVVEEQVVAAMRDLNCASVFDRAPVLLGAGGHFPHVRDQPVGVAAEGAVNLFDPVQVRQLVPVDREVLAARHTCHSVDGEANRLIERHPQVEQQEWKQQRVDERSGQKAEKTAVSNVGR